MEVWPHVQERVRLLWVCKSVHWQISSNVRRAAGEYLGDLGEVLALIHGGAMVVLHLRSGATERFALAWKFSEWTFFCRVSEFGVLGVGSRPAAVQTYAIELRRGGLADGGKLNIARSSPGLMKYGEQVYVFGGYNWNEDVLPTEIYNITSRTFRLAASMHFPRDGFSPCLWEDGIYLLDVGYSHRAIERFSLLSETIAILTWLLPQALTDNSIAYIHKGAVFLLSNTGLLATTVLGSQDWRTRQISTRAGCGLSNTPPVLLGNRLAWVKRGEGSLVQLDLDSCVLIE